MGWGWRNVRKKHECCRLKWKPWSFVFSISRALFIKSSLHEAKLLMQSSTLSSYNVCLSRWRVWGPNCTSLEGSFIMIMRLCIRHFLFGNFSPWKGFQRRHTPVQPRARSLGLLAIFHYEEPHERMPVWFDNNDSERGNGSFETTMTWEDFQKCFHKWEQRRGITVEEWMRNYVRFFII